MSAPDGHDLDSANPWPGGPRPAVESVVGGTVADRITAILREEILLGNYTRGSRLDLDLLAERFGTSRTPVREAMFTLSQEGLAHVAQRSRVTVIGLTPQDVRDNFDVMAVLSGVAAKWAAYRMDDAARTQITRAWARISSASEENDLVRLSWDFHREINLASGAESLINQLRNAGRLVPRTFFELVPEQISCSRVEHDEIFTALMARDGDGARTVTERHFRNAGRSLAARLEAVIEF
ncbi:GntR family transcriptional regulator [Gordonia sp. SCSIO 19800]|uniref:GntR family transcriptional regulator n=1 Tax=Gordonia sp. SCSIO 19800 TaxID=2826926 RepID=UPI001B839975|nr:GntR family transcriptional regulator [Gordonia sp. SCSIO 19800]MBR7194623.1 GntR family transcriptional regulator [Gordonia sp. SCSIO 19800]